jgi:hypothetical protein
VEHARVRIRLGNLSKAASPDVLRAVLAVADPQVVRDIRPPARSREAGYRLANLEVDYLIEVASRETVIPLVLP